MAVHLVIAWLYHYHYYFFTVCIYFPGHSWVQKEKKFWFSYVSTSGGVLAKYLIMGYKVIYMEGCYCRTLKKWKSLSHVWLFATLWTAARDPMDCSLPGSSVHEILQTGILEWVAIPFSRRSSQPRDWTQVFHIAGRCFAIWATREAPLLLTCIQRHLSY